MDFCFRIEDRNEGQYRRVKCRGYEMAMEDGGTRRKVDSNRVLVTDVGDSKRQYRLGKL